MSERIEAAKRTREAADEAVYALIDAAREGEAGAAAELQAWAAFTNNLGIDIRKALRAPKVAP